MLIKHEAKPSALLASRPPAKCFILSKPRARQYFYYFKEFPEKRFDKTCSLVHCNLNSANLFIFMSYNYARGYASWYFLIAKLASYWIMFFLIYKWFIRAKCLEKQETKT